MGNQTPNSDERNIAQFGLKITQITKNGETNMNLRSENEGIPVSEVLLIVESWLEKLKETHKNQIKSGLKFK